MLETRLDAHLGGARRVLLAGCGGGYDVLGAIPLAHQLRARGVAVELASPLPRRCRLRGSATAS